MFKFAVAIGMLCGFAGAAHAADPQFRGGYFPDPAPVVLRDAPKAFDWNRCYAGAQTGASLGKATSEIGKTDFFNAYFIKDLSTNMIGPIAGGQVGCNMVLNNNFLVGFEFEGIYQSKSETPCVTQVDPVTYCLKMRKKAEAFASARFGYTFGCGECGAGTLVYARLGVGYGRIDISGNINAISYVSSEIKDNTGYWGVGVYRPSWAQNYDVNTSRTSFAPVLGVGVERALNHQWTVRADISTMFGIQTEGDLNVTKIHFLNGAQGETLPPDLSQVKRNPRVGDVIPFKIKELETRLSMGVNRMF